MRKFTEAVLLVFNTESTWRDKISSLIGVTGGVSVSVVTSPSFLQTEAYFWFRSITFMVIGTLVTFIMPKIWNYLYKRIERYAEKRKCKK